MTTYFNNGSAAKPRNPMYAGGKKLRTVHANLSVVASAAVNGDVFILAGALELGWRIHRIIAPMGTPALTTAADNDLGFFRKTTDGEYVAIDADILWDGATLASAITDKGVDLLNTLNASLDQTKNIGELLQLGSDEDYVGGVYLGLTMNTASTADGELDLDVVIEEATTN